MLNKIAFKLISDQNRYVMVFESLILPSILACVLSAPVPETWTLTSESTGQTDFYQTMGTYSYPTAYTYDDPPGPTLSPAPGNVLVLDYVTQDKGEETWNISWAEDLETLYYDYDLVPFQWGSGAGEPITVNFGAGMYRLRAIVTSDDHQQQWHGSVSGTAIRIRRTESYQGDLEWSYMGDID